VEPFAVNRHRLILVQICATRQIIILIALIPLSAVFIRTAVLSWPQFWDTVTTPRVVASYRLTFGASLAAAAVNAAFGLLVSWVLVRYRFPGKRLIDALVDLPFALPTIVAGLTLLSVAVYDLAGPGPARVAAWIVAPESTVTSPLAFRSPSTVPAIFRSPWISRRPCRMSRAPRLTTLVPPFGVLDAWSAVFSA